MTTALTGPDRLALPGVLAMVLADESGITNADIRRQLGHAEYRVRKILGALSRSGEAGHIRQGPGRMPKWYSAAKAAEIRAEIAATALEKKRARNRAYMQKHATAKRAVGKDVSRVVQEIYPASVPLPFKVRAPASVFQLAGGGV